VSTEVLLLLLRVASAICLLALLGAIFTIIWKEYRGTVSQLQANRRSYGQLVVLQEIDGSYVIMGETYPLLPLTSLGRAPTNHVIVNDNFASSEHALVVLRNGQWWLEDRHSRNGTTLNEMPVTQPVVMTTGDIIGIGQKRFKLELER
jgi:hypothetical protein